MSLLLSLDEIYVRVELLADGVWGAEYDKTGFLSVGVNIFNRLFLKNNQFPCPWWKLLLKNGNMINNDKWESSTNRQLVFKMNDQNSFSLDPHIWKRSENRKMSINSFWWILKICILIEPFLLKEYNLFS